MSPNALDYITIRGFKSIASVEKLPLRAINLLIGANGSGKSNFLSAFSFFTIATLGNLRNYVAAAGGAEKVLHFGSKTTREIVFQFPSRLGYYELTLAPTEDDSLFPDRKNVAEGNSA